MSLRSVLSGMKWRFPKVTGAWVLGGLLTVVALLTARSAWIAFPLTLPLRGGQILIPGSPLPAGALFSVLLLAGVVLARWSRASAVLLVAAALAVALKVPLHAAQQPDWLQDYLVQTTDRLEMSQFLVDHYTLNLSPEPALAPVDRIDGTDDQIHLGILMLARPWYVSVLCAAGLLLVLVWRWQPAQPGVWLAAVLAIGVAALLPDLRALERAQAHADAGERHLAGGDGRAALRAYRTAYDLNPALRASRPFWSRVTMALTQVSSGRDPQAALLVNPWALWLQRPAPDSPALYADAVRQIDAAAPGPSSREPLEAGLRRATADLRTDLQVRQSLQLRAAGNMAASFSILTRVELAPTRLARFYLADATMRQGGWLQAVGMLKDLDARIAHPTVRADIACTMGDSLTGAGQLTEARRAYLYCKELDELTNYRLTQALGGT